MRSDPDVFYGALAVDTACAEQEYWRWKFLSDAIDLAEIVPVAHTAFKTDVTTQAIDLRERLFARDPGQGECLASLTHAAFASPQPHPVRETWWLRVGRDEVVRRCEQRSLVFFAEPWQSNQ
jgi:hypothetical protein